MSALTQTVKDIKEYSKLNNELTDPYKFQKGYEKLVKELEESDYVKRISFTTRVKHINVKGMGVKVVVTLFKTINLDNNPVHRVEYFINERRVALKESADIYKLFHDEEKFIKENVEKEVELMQSLNKALALNDFGYDF